MSLTARCVCQSLYRLLFVVSHSCNELSHLPNKKQQYKMLLKRALLTLWSLCSAHAAHVVAACLRLHVSYRLAAYSFNILYNPQLHDRHDELSLLFSSNWISWHCAAVSRHNYSSVLVPGHYMLLGFHAAYGLGPFNGGLRMCTARLGAAWSLPSRLVCHIPFHDHKDPAHPTPAPAPTSKLDQ
jgi:hypothetical protein